MENYRKFFKVVATVAFIGMVLFSNMLGVKNVYAYNSTIADHSKDKEFYVARRYTSIENGINSYPIRLFGPYQSSNPRATKTPDIKEWEIAYCINGYFSQTLGRGWAIPSGDQSTLAYAKMPYTQENVYRMVGDYDNVQGYNYHSEVPLNIDQILKKILYIGYPYDAKNLQQNLGDRQFEQVTQAVIYNYTDHSSKGAKERDTLKGIGGEVYTAYQKMVDLIDNHFDELVMPSDFEVNIYEWYHHPLRTDYVSYQNLLTSSISERRIPIKFRKVDNQNQILSGARIQAMNSDSGKDYGEWISGEDKVLNLLPGNYEFIEKSAPKGYEKAEKIVFRISNAGKVTYKNESGRYVDMPTDNGTYLLKMVDEKSSVVFRDIIFSKRNLNGDEIAGAKIQIKQDEEVVEQWISEEGQSYQISLAPGIYTFHEEAAPKGYVAVTDFMFTVKEDGTVEVHETPDAKVKDGKVVVTDQAEKKKVTFSKQDIAGNEIAGAQIQIKQGEKVVEKWTSAAGKSHQISLAPGIYTFHEEAAPKGYVAVVDFTFIVQENGTVEVYKTLDAKVKDGKVVVTDQAEKKTVTFSKQDIAGKEIAGAQIQIKQGEEVVEKWTSKEGQSHQISLAPGSYTFHEEAAPKGYVAVTDFEFTVKADGTVEVHETPDAKVKDGKVVVTDQVDKKEVVFSKQDIAGKEIAGAQIELKQGEEVVASWTSKADESHKVKLVPGTYTFHEEAAPNGYLAVTDFTFTVNADGTVELGETSDAKVKDGKVVVTDQVDKKEVVFSKQDIAGKEIAGAQIQIKQGEEVVEKWTSKEGQSHQISLAPGSYTFHEESAPKGYVAVTDFEFTVNADGTVEVHETPDAKVKDGKVVVTDQAEKKTVTFSKQDIAGKEIAGAQIQIKQGEEVVEKWTSKEGQSHQISLAPGSYTFHEESAPKGYVAVTDFEFTVNADGTVEVHETPDAKVKDGKVVVTDQAEKKTVTFSKQDIAGNEITGAKIQIKQGDKVVESWTSEADKSHTVKLEPGEYTFHEEAAPNGYLAVTDFTFTVNADGTVELGETSDAKVKDGKVVVTDQAEKKTVTFSKQDIAGKEIVGAQIQIKQGEEVVEKWTSKEGQSHQINLAPGSYTFHEESAPKGYVAVTDFEFTVNADGTVEVHETPDAKVKDGKVVVTDQAEKKTVTFSKQDIAGNEIAGAKIQIKQGDKVVESWTSEAGKSHTVELEPGEYTFHEEAAPNGYLAVTDFTFTVKADGTVELGETSDAKIEDGKLLVTVQLDKKEVVFSKQDIAGKEIAGAQIELKQGEEVVASWTSKADESHKVKLAPGTYTFHEEAAPNGYLAVTDFTFTVKADGTVELGETSDAKIKDGKLVVTDQKKPEVPTVTTKKVVFSKQNVAGDEIAGAKIQIKQGDKVVESWTSEAGKSHTVELEPGTYTFHEEAAPNGYLAVTDFTFTVKADGTVEVSATPDAKVENGKLVVTDQKEPDTPNYVNPKEGNLGTTVSANDLMANETHAVNLPSTLSKQVKVVDTIYYTDLVAGESYQLTGALMKITANDQAQTIATQTAKVVADATGTGTWSLNFGTLALEPGTKYVIFETATSEKPLVDTNKDNQPDVPHVVEHKNPNDLAQTIVVAKEVPTPTPTPVEKGNLRTTVSAANQNGSATKPATITAEQAKKVAVKDTVMYEKLVANQAYQLVGTLMHVKDGKVTPIATQSKDVIADQTGNGQWVLDFGTLTLQSGETYVVYEVATSKENLVDTNNDGEMDDSQVVEHKNPNDLSQTIVVENEKPTEPTKPQPKEIIFSKQNVDGEEIAGAQIQIKQNGKVISEWTSKEGQSHVIKLLPGTYTFHEEAAPNGYLKVTDFEFTISEDGKVSLTGKGSDVSMVNGKLVIVDQRKEIIPPTPTPEPTPEPTPTEPQPKEIIFSKQNVDGEEIAGAQIQIKQNGKVISEWTSKEGQSHVITLLPGTYTFHEEAAPNGYLKVTDFEFTISEDGKVSLTGKGSDVSMVNGKLVIVDQRKEIIPPTPTPEPTPTEPQPKEIIFSKQNVDGEEIAGAQIQIKQNGKVISEWTSKEGQSHVIKLLPGTYTFHEEAAPNGYLKVTDFEFTIDKNGKVSLTNNTQDIAIINGKVVVVDRLQAKERPTLSKDDKKSERNVNSKKTLPKAGSEEIDALLGWTLLVFCISIYVANTRFRSYREENQ